MCKRGRVYCVSDNERLMKDALAAIEKLQARVAELEADLSKARGTKPNLGSNVRDAITKSLRTAGSGANQAVAPGLIAKAHAKSPAVRKLRDREAAEEADFT